MRTKKVLRILTVVLAFFAFAVNAHADKANCDPCASGKDPNCAPAIPCPSTIPGRQGEPTINIPVSPFDWDGDRTQNIDQEAYIPWGYAAGDVNRRCKFVYDICHNCEGSCDFQVGTTIGIRMTIKTGGVFWAAPTVKDNQDRNTVKFAMYPFTVDEASYICGLDSMLQPVTQASQLIVKQEDQGKFPNDLYSGKSVYDGTEGFNPHINQDEIRNFGEVVYYTPEGAVATPVGGELARNLVNTERATVLRSEWQQDYTLTANDVQNRRCIFWIDIPPMRLDGTALSPATIPDDRKIDVEVEFLFNRGTNDPFLCPYCTTEKSCSCVIEVGEICPPQAPSAVTTCVYFPYVTVADAQWWTGVAVANLSSVNAPVVDMTLTDSNGNVFTYHEAMTPTDVKGWVLRSIPWVGTGTPQGHGWLTIKGNFQMDGYQFLTNDTFGAGTLARRECIDN